MYLTRSADFSLRSLSARGFTPIPSILTGADSGPIALRFIVPNPAPQYRSGITIGITLTRCAGSNRKMKRGSAIRLQIEGALTLNCLKQRVKYFQ